jgi:transposase
MLSGTLMPQLRPGDVMMMDHARFYRPQELRRLVRRSGLQIIFLPPYSLGGDARPDLNRSVKVSLAALRRKFSRSFLGGGLSRGLAP